MTPSCKLLTRQSSGQWTLAKLLRSLHSFPAIHSPALGYVELSRMTELPRLLASSSYCH